MEHRLIAGLVEDGSFDHSRDVSSHQLLMCRYYYHLLLLDGICFSSPSIDSIDILDFIQLAESVGDGFPGDASARTSRLSES